MGLKQNKKKDIIECKSNSTVNSIVQSERTKTPFFQSNTEKGGNGLLLSKCMCVVCVHTNEGLPELTNCLLQKYSVLSQLPLVQILPASRADVQ